MELRELADAADRAAAEERALEQVARAAVPTGWTALQSAAKAIAHSDGLSDHAALVAALKAALAEVWLVAS